MTKDMTKPKKPFCLEYDEAEGEIFSAVDEAAKKIPFYLIEGILTNILHQVRANAKAEKVSAAKSYEKQIKEYEAETEGSENE